jgi:hypothetical protein
MGPQGGRCPGEYSIRPASPKPAVTFAVAVAFFVVIPQGDLLLSLLLPLPLSLPLSLLLPLSLPLLLPLSLPLLQLPFWLSSPKGICF